MGDQPSFPLCVVRQIGGKCVAKAIFVAVQLGLWLTLSRQLSRGTGGQMVARTKYRKGALPFEFVPIPFAILRHPEYIALSDRAKALMLDLCEQYSGGNNGRLTPSFTAMVRRGWGGKHKLIHAKRELLATSFCLLTRKGRPPQTAEWVGFTWWKIDYHKTMGIDPKLWPHLNFQTLEKSRIDPNYGREKLNPAVPKQHRCKSPGGVNTAPIGQSRIAI